MTKNYHNIKENILHLTRSGANTRDMYDYIHMVLKKELPKIRQYAQLFYKFKPKSYVTTTAEAILAHADITIEDDPELLLKCLDRYLEDNQITEYVAKDSVCFFSNQRKCNAKKTPSRVFIAGSTHESLTANIELIKSCLKDEKYKPIFASDEIKMSLDIFCERICSKIRTSRFCISYLTAPMLDDKEIPNPNVYWEYGFMKSLDKKVIPIIQEDQKLYFDVQGLGSILYSDQNDLKNQLLAKIKEFESAEDF